jgi:hypothetical protein
MACTLGQKSETCGVQHHFPGNVRGDKMSMLGEIFCAQDIVANTFHVLVHGCFI